MCVLNDEAADGEDVSWIWDAGFEMLANRVAFVAASGTRAYDLALRLKYAGVNTQLVEPDPKSALIAAVDHTPPGETLYILPTYTAMLTVRNALEQGGFAAAYWEQVDVSA